MGHLPQNDKQKLHDLWVTRFFRALDRLPPPSVFRVEFEKVKDLPFEEAKEKILVVAGEIIAEMRTREMERRAKQASVKRTPAAAAFSRVPPAKFLTAPMSPLKFPRRPSSEEQIRLWNVFQYQMQQHGYNANAYYRQFDEYIQKATFLSWEDLRSRFDFFLREVMAGEDLPPLAQWYTRDGVPTGLAGELQGMQETERTNALIAHYAEVIIVNSRHTSEKPTLRALYEELTSKGIIAADTLKSDFKEMAKSAVQAAFNKREMGTVTPQEIDDFLASDC
jgi:hypothetical protein